jgi:hypothetical protein
VKNELPKCGITTPTVMVFVCCQSS